MKVLQRETEINEAREILMRRGLSCLQQRRPVWFSLPGRHKCFQIGDQTKSWDVLETLRFIETHVSKTEPILDIGAFASEMPLALHKLGYCDLHGIDLNPKVAEMPESEEIDYRIGDFMQTPFQDHSIAAITAVSVIEHGFDGPRLLAEVSRLLKKDGYFIGSFDYWPEKIDTNGVRFFGMDWRIFSREDVLEFCKSGEAVGLRPVGDLAFEANNRVITCAGQQYTFAWLALRRMDGEA
jgi:SAM-dependent methyltransferase